MTIKKSSIYFHHSGQTVENKSKPNAILPEWLYEAMNTPCPFCGGMPSIEPSGGKSSFVCHSAFCPVEPETGYYPLELAARTWTRRARAWAKLLMEEHIDLSSLDEMDLYGIAKRFQMDIVQMEPLMPSLED